MFVMLLAALLLLVCVWNLYYEKHWYQQVEVTLDFDRPYVYAKDQTELKEVITNRKKLPVPVLEVGFHTRKELNFEDTENTNVSDYIYKRDIFAVLGRQKITRTIPIRCMKRGYYKVEEADITAFSLLYRKRYARSLSTQAAIYVYPMWVDVSETMTVCERMLGTMQCAKHLYEDPFAFRGIREYTINDPMKLINWKASAKTGELMVNTFDSVMTQKVMIYLDVEDSGILKQEELVEESIAVAASMVRKLLRQGIEVGLSTNARYKENPSVQTRFSCNNSRFLLTEIEQSLALYCKENGSSAYEECLDKTGAEEAVLIFISKNISQDRQRVIEDCLGKEQYGIWLCPAYRGDSPQVNVTKNLKFVVREVERG